MPTSFTRLPTLPQVSPVLVPATQLNIAQPPHNNLPTFHPNIVNVNGTLIPPGYSHSPAAYSLDVNVLTPKSERGIFPYRHHVEARLSLAGTVPLQCRDVVLSPVRPNESQLMLWCSACISSRHPQCSPIGYYLNPVLGGKHNQGFNLDPSSRALTGNATFTIEHRPRRPKAHEYTRRCASESLMFTFSLHNQIDHIITERQVGPFRARSHTKRGGQNGPPQQHADGPHPHSPNRGVPSAVRSLPQTSASILPVEYILPAYPPVYPPPVHPPVYPPPVFPPPYPPLVYPPLVYPPVYPPPVYPQTTGAQPSVFDYRSRTML